MNVLAAASVAVLRLVVDSREDVLAATAGVKLGMGEKDEPGIARNTHAIVGRADHLFVGENPGSPVEMRVIEPRIGGYEIGVIGAFNAAVFDTNSFAHLGTHL